MKTKRIALMAMCIALAMILSYVEAQLPSLGIPGVKMGLANLVVVFCLYRLGWKEAADLVSIAVERTLRQGITTADIADSFKHGACVGTKEFGKAVVERM